MQKSINYFGRVLGAFLLCAARSLKAAVALDGTNDIPSTKGVL